MQHVQGLRLPDGTPAGDRDGMIVLTEWARVVAKDNEEFIFAALGHPTYKVNLDICRSNIQYWKKVKQEISNIDASIEVLKKSRIDPKAQLLMARGLNRFYGLDSDEMQIQPKNILFTLGGSGGLDVLFTTLRNKNPNGCILTPFPHYTLYAGANEKNHLIPIHMVRDEGGKRYRLTKQNLKDAFLNAKSQGKDVSALVFCGPNNPLGNVLSEEELEAIAGVMYEEQQECCIIFDEAYSKLSFTPNANLWLEFLFEKFTFSENDEQERLYKKLWGKTSILQSATKGDSVSGERYACIVNLNDSIEEDLTQENDSIGYPPESSQISYAVATAKLTDRHFDAQVESLREYYEFQVRFAEEELKSARMYISDSYTVEGAFYVILKLEKLYNYKVKDKEILAKLEKAGFQLEGDKLATDEQIAYYILFKHKVALIPLSYFGVDSKFYLRMTCSLGKSKLSKIINRLKKEILNHEEPSSSVNQSSLIVENIREASHAVISYLGVDSRTYLRKTFSTLRNRASSIIDGLETEVLGYEASRVAVEQLPPIPENSKAVFSSRGNDNIISTTSRTLMSYFGIDPRRYLRMTFSIVKSRFSAILDGVEKIILGHEKILWPINQLPSMVENVRGATLGGKDHKKIAKSASTDLTPVIPMSGVSRIRNKEKLESLLRVVKKTRKNFATFMQQFWQDVFLKSKSVSDMEKEEHERIFYRFKREASKFLEYLFDENFFQVIRKMCKDNSKDVLQIEKKGRLELQGKILNFLELKEDQTKSSENGSGNVLNIYKGLKTEIADLDGFEYHHHDMVDSVLAVNAYLEERHGIKIFPTDSEIVDKITDKELIKFLDAHVSIFLNQPNRHRKLNKLVKEQLLCRLNCKKVLYDLMHGQEGLLVRILNVLWVEEKHKRDPFPLIERIVSAHASIDYGPVEGNQSYREKMAHALSLWYPPTLSINKDSILFTAGKITTILGKVFKRFFDEKQLESKESVREIVRILSTGRKGKRNLAAIWYSSCDYFTESSFNLIKVQKKLENLRRILLSQPNCFLIIDEREIEIKAFETLLTNYLLLAGFFKDSSLLSRIIFVRSAANIFCEENNNVSVFIVFDKNIKSILLNVSSKTYVHAPVSLQHGYSEAMQDFTQRFQQMKREFFSSQSNAPTGYSYGRSISAHPVNAVSFVDNDLSITPPQDIVPQRLFLPSVHSKPSPWTLEATCNNPTDSPTHNPTDSPTDAYQNTTEVQLPKILLENPFLLPPAPRLTRRSFTATPITTGYG